MPDRRIVIERRTSSRASTRRAEERRDSPRVVIAFDVREPGQRARSAMGDLSIEGASFVTSAPPLGDDVEMLFSIPNFAAPIIAKGQVVSRTSVERGTLIGLAFTKIDVEAQLAVAEWLDMKAKTLCFAPSAQQIV